MSIHRKIRAAQTIAAAIEEALKDALRRETVSDVKHEVRAALDILRHGLDVPPAERQEYICKVRRK